MNGPVEAVVMGLSPTGLYAVRELGRAGVRVGGVAASRQAGTRSRYLADCVVAANPAGRLDALLDGFAAPGAPLIPCSDQDVAFCVEHAATLAAHLTLWPSVADGTAARIMDKEWLYGIAEANGMAVPRTRTLARSDLADAAGELDYPCLLKPSLIHEVKHWMAGRKAWIARDAEHLRALEAEWPPQEFTLLVQEIVAGPDSAIELYCAYFDGAGNAQEEFTARKLRQYPPGFGSASMVQSEDLPEIRECSRQLARLTGYRGILATEFKRDANTGVLKLIESNPRPSLWFAAASAAGKRLCVAAVREAGVRLDETIPAPPAGRSRWRYAGKDHYSAAHYRLRRDFVLPAPSIPGREADRVSVDAVLARDDPAPAFGEVSNMVSKAWRRIVGKPT